MAAIGIKETPSTTTSLATAFDEWLDGLDTPQATLTKHSMEILAKSMRKSMALRDAMLLSVICAGNPEYDKGKLRDYAAAPRIPNHQLSEWCERMMKWSFAHAGHETDKDKVLNASRMLVDIVDTVEDTDLKLQAQPLAIISYILWWMGARARHASRDARAGSRRGMQSRRHRRGRHPRRPVAEPELTANHHQAVTTGLPASPPADHKTRKGTAE